MYVAYFSFCELEDCWPPPAIVTDLLGTNIYDEI